MDLAMIIMAFVFGFLFLLLAIWLIRIIRIMIKLLLKDEDEKEKLNKKEFDWQKSERKRQANEHAKRMMEIDEARLLNKRLDSWRKYGNHTLEHPKDIEKRIKNRFASGGMKNDEGRTYDNDKVLHTFSSWEDLQGMEDRVNDRSINDAESESSDNDFGSFGNGGEFGGGGSDSSWSSDSD